MGKGIKERINKIIFLNILYILNIKLLSKIIIYDFKSLFKKSN